MTKWLWAWCVAQVVSHAYSVLARGLLEDYPMMWAAVIETLGWAYLAQKATGDDDNGKRSK
jgi:hypothetical protein